MYETEKCKKNLNFFCIFCPWQAEPAVAATATVAMIIASTHAGAGVKNLKQGIPCGLGGERWTCEPRVSGSIPGASNLKKVVNLDENLWTPTKIVQMAKWIEWMLGHNECCREH